MFLILTQRLTPRLTDNYRRLSGFSLYDQVLVDRTLRGTVAYIGETEFADGVWVGVYLRENNAGRNNGTVQGKCYFRCAPNRGLFVRPSRLSSPSQVPLPIATASSSEDCVDLLSLCPSLIQILSFVTQSDRLRCRLVNRQLYTLFMNTRRFHTPFLNNLNKRDLPRKECHLDISQDRWRNGGKMITMRLKGWGDRASEFEQTIYYVTEGRIRLRKVLEQAHYDHVKSMVGERFHWQKGRDDFGDATIYPGENAEQLDFRGRGDYDDFRTNGIAHGLRILFRMLCKTRYFHTLRIDAMSAELLEEVCDGMLNASIGTLQRCQHFLGPRGSEGHPKVWKLAHDLGVEYLQFLNVNNVGKYIQTLFNYPIDCQNIQLKSNVVTLISLRPVFGLLKMWQSGTRRIQSIEMLDFTKRVGWTHEQFRRAFATLPFVDHEPEYCRRMGYMILKVRRRADDNLLYLRISNNFISIKADDTDFHLA